MIWKKVYNTSFLALLFTSFLLDEEEGKCICFGEASEMIDQYKKAKYPIQILKNSTVETEDRNCILVSTKGNEKVKDQYDQCIDALKGTLISSLSKLRRT